MHGGVVPGAYMVALCMVTFMVILCDGGVYGGDVHGGVHGGVHGACCMHEVVCMVVVVTCMVVCMVVVCMMTCMLVVYMVLCIQTLHAHLTLTPCTHTTGEWDSDAATSCEEGVCKP